LRAGRCRNTGREQWQQGRGAYSIAVVDTLAQSAIRHCPAQTRRSDRRGWAGTSTSVAGRRRGRLRQRARQLFPYYGAAYLVSHQIAKAVVVIIVEIKNESPISLNHSQ
jgi:hypothetical protein